MPHIGIIRGFGEGFVATGYIIEIIKALKRRFRTKLTFSEISLGDYLKYGSELDGDAVSEMGKYDVIFAGDMKSKSNPLEYTIADIAMVFGCDVEYTCISGFGENASVDVHIASYFDGGTKLREGTRDAGGCSETRICSTYSAKNIAKYISRRCEDRRRRLCFVKDGDNEYCADLFYSRFEDYTLPLTNFRLINISTDDIIYEMLYNPSQFDTIFASKTFSDMAWGIYKAKMQSDFAAYNKFARQKNIYSLRSIAENSPSDTVLSMNSYIIALADMLNCEFGMSKEAESLRLALEDAVRTGFSPFDGAAFINKIIELIQRPVTTKHLKRTPKKHYIIK